ncbi:MAG: leucine-rich repeat domain-containing protein [Promethearchaeota archaeon]|jgi:Leucine-rich repeat (LRR) protein
MTRKNSHLLKIEKEVLQELESTINQAIPLMETCEYNKLGFSIKNNHIFGLSLANQKLTIFPKCILRLKFLRELWFLENRIQDLPEKIGDLKYLIRIDMENNFSLSNLPESVWKLKKLEVLGLGGNKFSKISEKITELPNLKYLFLENNKFTEIPEFIWNLTQLEVLGLGGNDFGKISPRLQEFTHLRFLNLKNLDFLGPNSRCVGNIGDKSGKAKDEVKDFITSLFR